MDKIFEVYKPYLRHAEQTDTRAPIRRRQQDQERREGHKSNDKEKDSIFGEDEITVSIHTLIGLLQDLLRRGVEAGTAGQSRNESERDESEKNEKNLSYGHSSENQSKSGNGVHGDHPDEDASGVESSSLPVQVPSAGGPRSAQPPSQSQQAAKLYEHAAETGGRLQPKPDYIEHPVTDPADYDAAGIRADKIDVDRIRALLFRAESLFEAGVKEVDIIDRGDFLVALENSIGSHFSTERT